jgi:diguanylate cyclase (GGDEF)-like protein/PAS domain S-box-containing protein
MRNIVSMYLIAASFLALAFSSYLLGKIRNNRTILLFFNMLSYSLYIFGYVLEYNSNALSDLKFWNHFQYLGVPFIPTIWLLVVLEYTGRLSHVLKKGKLIFLIFLEPTITTIINFTNKYHHLYYASIKVIETFGHKVLSLHKGPWYFVHTGYLTVILFAALYFLYTQFKQDKSRRPLIFLFLLATIMPIFGIYMNIIDVFKDAFDYGTLAASLSILVIIFAVIKYDFLEIITTARDQLFEISREALILLDIDYNILDMNSKATKLFDVERRKVLNRNIDHVFFNDKGLLKVLKEINTGIWMKAKKEGKEEGEGVFFYEVTTVEVVNKFTKKIGYLKTIRDITEEVKLKSELERAAKTDTLTGLHNRFCFMELANKEFERVKRYNEGFCIMMIDIDNFKKINDSYGHGAGDLVLKNLGTIMNANFRVNDIIGRIGGEEFAVVLVNTKLEDAERKAEIFRKMIENTVLTYGDTIINFTLSIGLTEYREEFKSFDEMLKAADLAMYCSKRNGKNRVTIYSSCSGC